MPFELCIFIDILINIVRCRYESSKETYEMRNAAAFIVYCEYNLYFIRSPTELQHRPNCVRGKRLAFSM